MSGRRLREFEDSAGAGSKRWQPEAEQRRWQPEAEQHRQQALADRDGHLFLRGLVEPGQALPQVAMEYARGAVHCALPNRGGKRLRLSADFRWAFGEGL